MQSMFLHCYKETITKMTCVAFVLRLERSWMHILDYVWKQTGTIQS